MQQIITKKKIKKIYIIFISSRRLFPCINIHTIIMRIQNDRNNNMTLIKYTICYFFCNPGQLFVTQYYFDRPVCRLILDILLFMIPPRVLLWVCEKKFRNSYLENNKNYHKIEYTSSYRSETNDSSIGKTEFP